MYIHSYISYSNVKYVCIHIKVAVKQLTHAITVFITTAETKLFTPLNSRYSLGEYITLCGKPNEVSMWYHVYIFMKYVDS